MYFISALIIGVALPGLPATILVPVDLAAIVQRQRIVRHVDDHVQIAEVARKPAPALHVDDDRVDLVLGRALPAFGLLTVEHTHGIGAEHAIGADVGAELEGLHRLHDLLIVARIVLVAGNVEPLAQRDDAVVLHARAQDLALGDAHLRRRFDFGLRLVTAVA
jgi:hypothetical protein